MARKTPRVQKDTNKDVALIALALDNARQDFWKFCLYMDYDFYTERIGILKPVAQTYNDAYFLKHTGMPYRINVAVLRRIGKSRTTGLFIAWVLGNNPNLKIMRGAHNMSLARSGHRDIIDVLKSERYLHIFPNVEIAIENVETIRLKGSEQDNVKSVSVGAGTGFGADILVLDDVYKDYLSARSEAIDTQVKRWYRTSWDSSLEGSIQLSIMIGTRWIKGELADEIEKRGQFDKIIKKPALVDGASVIPSVISTERLLALQAGNIMEFNSQYQQEYTDAEVGIIDSGNMLYYEVEVIARMQGLTFAMIDNKSTGNDYFAIGIYKVLSNSDVVLIDTIFTQNVLSDELENRIASLIAHYRCVFSFFETNHNPSFFYNMQKKIRAHNVGTQCVGFKTKTNKEVKIQSMIKYIRKIKYVMTDDAEYNAFLNNVISYDLKNKNKHDDAPDNMAMACEQVLLTSYGRRLGVSDEWK